ncbi:MAG: hypothetical protein ACKD6O_08045 [Candidatus Bathyarchaeota archaeon]
MSSQFEIRYRKFKLGYLASQFEQIFYKLRKGEDIPVENILYFLSYAKNFLRRIGFKEDYIEKLERLAIQWEYWTNVRTKLVETGNIGIFYSIQPYLDYEFVTFNYDLDTLDLEISSLAFSNRNFSLQYYVKLLNIKLKELLYNIISEIWLVMYEEPGLIKDSEIRTILEAVQSEFEKPPNTFIEYEVDENVDIEKTVEPHMVRKIDNTVACFRRVYKIMKIMLDEFRRGFYSTSDFYSKLCNCEAYVFITLLTASKILIDNPQVKELLILNAELIKRIEQYRFLKSIHAQLSPDVYKDLSLKLMSQLEPITVKALESVDKLLNTVVSETESEKEKEGSKEKIEYELISELTEHDKKNLVGFEIDYDIVTGILEQMKTGERLTELLLQISPYTLTPNKLKNSAIIMVIGKTGSGKTVFGINLIRMFVNNDYTVVDISLNVKRAQEMIYCIMPLNEQLYKQEFHKLTKIQQCTPEKINSYILIPYTNTNMLPKYLPSCCRIFTIPLKSLAGKPYAYGLLFSRVPDKDVIEIIDLIISNVATEDWDLNTLRFYLKKLANEQKPTIEVYDKIGDMKVKRKIEVEQSLVKKVLRSLKFSSDLISSSNCSTAIDFDKLTEKPLFIQLYLGHVDEYTAYMINRWWIYSWIDYKVKKPETKLAMYLNEAQTVVPSQTMVGGIFSEEKYGSAVDVSSLVLQFRGLGIYVIALTQMPGQLKKQFPSQQGALAVFHTTDENDLEYAFNDIPSEEMRTNLRMLIKSRFAFEQHLCVLKFGPEAEQIKIVLSAMPPCAIERPNMDVFDLYYKLYPQETVETRTLIEQIENERKIAVQKALEKEISAGIIEVLEEGKTLVPVAPQQIVVSKDEIDKVLSPDYVVVPKKELEQTVKLDKDKVVVDKEYVETLEKTRPIGEDKIVLPIDKYEQLIKDYGLPSLNDVENIGSVRASNNVQTCLQVLKFIIIGCKPGFKFTRTRSKSADVLSDIENKLLFRVEDILHKQGFPSIGSVAFYNHVAIHMLKDPLINKLCKKTVPYGRGILVFETLKLTLSQIEAILGEEYVNKVLHVCALKYYENAPELPWREEVINLYKKLKSLGSENEHSETEKKPTR